MRGEDNVLLRSFRNLHYTPVINTGTTDFGAYRPSVVRRAVAILNVARKEVELAAEPRTPRAKAEKDGLQQSATGSMREMGRRAGVSVGSFAGSVSRMFSGTRLTVALTIPRSSR